MTMQYEWGEAEESDQKQQSEDIGLRNERIIKYTLTWKDLTPEAQKAVRAFFKECEDARAEGFSSDDYVVNIYGVKEDKND